MYVVVIYMELKKNGLMEEKTITFKRWLELNLWTQCK